MKVYVASSWGNAGHPIVVATLRAAGHEVYDFRNPEPGNSGFSWYQVDLEPTWLSDPAHFREGIQHPAAQRGFQLDMNALRACEACVLVLPCGGSAHIGLGWAAGAGKKTVVLLDAPLSELDLMYLACTTICISIEEVLSALTGLESDTLRAAGEL